MTNIIGVDFSGAARDRNTWFAQGHLDQDGRLQLERGQPIRRKDLCSLLLGLAPPAVVAMDFPFGLPEAFLTSIAVGNDYPAIDQIWPVLACTNWDDLTDAATEFVDDFGEPRCAVDHHYPEAKSTLHRVNPDMLPMTYQGAKLLSYGWDENDRPPWRVLPLDPPQAPPEEVVTIMETMPGAFLRSVRLPYRGYKGNGPEALLNRDRIIGEIAANSGIEMPNLDNFRYACRCNDDCLDAVVAAACAAAWSLGTLPFRVPNPDEEAAARREGWLYAPIRQDG